MKYSDQTIIEVTKKARSFHEVVRLLGANPGSGGVYQHIKRRITVLGVDTSHFVGLSANAGVSPANRRSSTELLIHNHALPSREKASRLRRALVDLGRAMECAGCEMTEWRGRKIVLQVDHINGDWRDNRPENLQCLCPNCHSQKTLDV